MAYTSSDLNLVPHSPLADNGTYGFQTWRYLSGDGQSTIGGSSYISDAYKKGMKQGDQVIWYSSTAQTLGSFLVKTVRTSTASAGANSADLSSGAWLSS